MSDDKIFDTQIDRDRIRQSEWYRRHLLAVRNAVRYREPQTLGEAISQLLLADACVEEGLEDVRDGDLIPPKMR